MSGSTDLDYLLQNASPVLDPECYVFVSCSAEYGAHASWKPVATVSEDEGMTFVIRQAIADRHSVEYGGVFARITLQVHSSLDAVGLTARFATRLAEKNISANVMAGFHHDHIFVAYADGPEALSVLSGLADS